MTDFIHIHRNRQGSALDTFLLFIPIIVFFLILFIIITNTKKAGVAQIESNQAILGGETETK